MLKKQPGLRLQGYDNDILEGQILSGRLRLELWVSSQHSLPQQLICQRVLQAVDENTPWIYSLILVVSQNLQWVQTLQNQPSLNLQPSVLAMNNIASFHGKGSRQLLWLVQYALLLVI